jgi:tetratricopeptide (TPR) repeat protein
MTQAGVVVWYLRLCFWPSPLVISYDDWKLAKHLSEILPQSLLIVALLAGTIWALRRRYPIGFIGAWFFLILAPSSSIVPIVTEIAAERRMYLPLAAVIVLLVIGAYHLLNVAARRFSTSERSFQRVGIGLALIAVAALCAGTIARNGNFRSETAIWSDTVSKRPGIAFAQFEYANALYASGEFDEAIRHYKEALRLKSEYPEAHTNYANLLADRGHLDEAIYNYQEAIRLRPDFAEAHNNLGTVLISQGKLDQAIEQITQALRIKPAWSAALSNLGLALIRKDRLNEAIERLRDAVKADPDIVQPRLLLAEALTKSNRLDEAIEQLRACLRTDPTNSIALEKLDAAMASRDAIRSR